MKAIDTVIVIIKWNKTSDFSRRTQNLLNSTQSVFLINKKIIIKKIKWRVELIANWYTPF